MVVDIAITAIYGKASAKYREGTQEYAFVFLINIKIFYLLLSFGKVVKNFFMFHVLRIVHANGAHNTLTVKNVLNPSCVSIHPESDMGISIVPATSGT